MKELLEEGSFVDHLTVLKVEGESFGCAREDHHQQDEEAEVQSFVSHKVIILVYISYSQCTLFYS